MYSEEILHDSDSRNWYLSLLIIQKFGYEGYGLYWALQELEAEWQNIYYADTPLIAFTLRTTEDSIKNLIDFILNEGIWMLNPDGQLFINKKETVK